MYHFDIQIIRTTWAKLKREDIRPDEGKQLQDDIAIKGKNEEGTELRLLDPSTLDQPENGEGKSSRSKGRPINKNISAIV